MQEKNTTDTITPSESRPGFKARLKQLVQGFWRRKLLTIPLTILVVLGITLIIPPTRYALLGTFLKRNFTVVVVDNKTGKPITKARVTLGTASGQTDGKGQISLTSHVGNKQLTVDKAYYKSNSANVLVPLKQRGGAFKVFVLATGRQVPISVVNKITGKPAGGVVVTGAGAEAKTDKQGKAVLVLPAGSTRVPVKISSAGYNDTDASVTVTEQTDKANMFTITPAGKIYFLSKLSGKIDVVKTDLDGGRRQIVLSGTGREDGSDTILLASRDWKYLALKSKRDGGENAKLFLISTAGDKLATIDEGNASFTLAGWSGHNLVFQVARNGYQNWQSKAQALKSYDAPNSKITLLDETAGEGSNQYDFVNNRYGPITLLDDEIVFYKNWSCCYYAPGSLSGRSVGFTTIKPDGSGRRTVREFPAPANQNYYSLDVRLYAPDELYISVPPTDGSNKTAFYEYEDGKIIADTDLTDQTFFESYPTHLESPSGSRTFWSEPRDGKNVLFTGDARGERQKQVGALSEYSQYGWYSDDYLLVSKGGSELAIMPSGGGTPLKIADYHKSVYNFFGYGKGYGGL